MSNKQNDLYLEELAEAEQDLQDFTKAFTQADKDLDEAIEWRRTRRIEMENAQTYLEKIKNKE